MAKEAKSKGLKIERIFTREGVHPYDEVTWERRDVIQTNWKSGEVVFEQRGVEFPEEWSMNATTIATTKYFRGTIGQDNREWSLKQLIDRVAKTYAREGQKAGYFAGEKDAEIFEHELTWMLLHQVFAFNSPVWFNVGTKDPQVVSACFILSVDDTMDSILNWYREEGMIFKGGSGAGLNLSKIRSSVETLSSGGTSSGPISFMRGADASAGTIKSGGACLAPWTKVYTAERGAVEVKELAESGKDFTVLSYDPAKGRFRASTARAFASGRKPLVSLDTDKGAFTVTPDHPVRLTTGEYVPAGELKEGMSILPVTIDWTSARGKMGDKRYLRVGLRDGRKGKLALHRLVALDLMGVDPEDELHVHHIHHTPEGDHDRMRNGVADLAVMTPAEHHAYHSMCAMERGEHAFQKLYFGKEREDIRGEANGMHATSAFKQDAEKVAQWHENWLAGMHESDVFRAGQDSAARVRMLNKAYQVANAGMSIDTFEEYYKGRVQIFGKIAKSKRQQLARIEERFGNYENFLNEVRANNHAVVSVKPMLDESDVYDVEVDSDTPEDRSKADGHNFVIWPESAESAHVGSGIVVHNTRRAAKMVVLDVDHPDIEEFIDLKAREEDKIRVLRDAGFDMDLGGKDIVSVQYQNANNSVRLSDEFMEAYEKGESFPLTARKDGRVVKEVDAKDLFAKISKAAWECADPGVQYSTTINKWHTNKATGPITASNPCFPGEQKVVTDKGLVRFADLVSRAAGGEVFQVYTNDVTALEGATGRVVATTPSQYMVTGRNPIVKLEFNDGSALRCTPNHRLWTSNRGWVEAENLTGEDQVVRSFHYAARTMAAVELPDHVIEAGRLANEATKGYKHSFMGLPEKWSEELGHYLGWLVGDGCLADGKAITVYGTAAEATTILPRHKAFLDGLTGADAKPSVQSNGTVQLRGGRMPWGVFLKALGVSSDKSSKKVVPEAILEAPEFALKAFLQGLFDADGTVVNDVKKGTRYVGVASRSNELLRGVQEILASLGIYGRIYNTGTKAESFTYTTVDREERIYGSDGPTYDLRISGRSITEFSKRVGFTLPGKKERLDVILEDHTFYTKDETVRLVSRTEDGHETTYNLTEERNHSYLVNGNVVSNCSEYLSIDDSACNLASLNLMKFLKNDNTFDIDTFKKVVEMVILAMDISVTFGDFPTEKITENTRAFRQLGIGYANLGALLMATGHGYDSEGGRALAAAITSLMTATAYRRSAEIAAAMGAYDGYKLNASAHTEVMRMHEDANSALVTLEEMDSSIKEAATEEWKKGNSLGEENGWRNAQASLLAPTGCLTGNTLVTTDRGLARMSELGDVYGDKWQDLHASVATDEGPQAATKFFVNGEEETRRITTRGGYTIQGTPSHRIKVVDPQTGKWNWKRFADITEGDITPLQLGELVGEPRRVSMPLLDELYYTNDAGVTVPTEMTPELAELVGYFMGDGSLHAKGLRFCVSNEDIDVLEHLKQAGKNLFNIEAAVTPQRGYQEVAFNSVRLVRWWDAAGLRKGQPEDGAMSWLPHIPWAVRETNNREVYGAFLRGLFEADGTVSLQVPIVGTAKKSFAEDVAAMLLVVGVPSTTRISGTSEWSGKPLYQIRVRNIYHTLTFKNKVGFIGSRKASKVRSEPSSAQAKRDIIFLPKELLKDLVPVGDPNRTKLTNALSKVGGISRSFAEEIYQATQNEQLGAALGYLYEKVTKNEDGGVQPTYDISVPSNVTYVANGFVSHNTIGFLMDVDTTGIEPDFALVKFKKLVGGGSLQIVNGTVSRALRRFGYNDEQINEIEAYISEHGHVVGAPHLDTKHYEVFDCAMGNERYIKPMGHIHMMAAVQPFLSGAISKTVNLPESASVEDIEQVYYEGWKLGLKAIAVYRDNCKVGQPLSSGKGENKGKADGPKAEVVKEVETVIVNRPERKRLPRQRQSMTTSYKVAGADGYITASNYPDGELGEVFLRLGKQGSTLAGVMDAFSIAVSIGLQYGVPVSAFVEKFTNMRFEPSGMTDDPELRMAQSVIDYIFRRLALDYMSFEERGALGIYTSSERARQLETGEYTPDPSDEDVITAQQSVSTHEKHMPETAPVVAPVAKPASSAHSSAELMELKLGRAADSPLCLNCGIKMRPSGSCYVCESCGSTSGCS